MNLQEILSAENVAEHLSNADLDEIVAVISEHYDTDVESRSDWEVAYGQWMGMTLQEIEKKTKPWPGAANIKYPLMTQAALNFNARVVPALMPNNQPVGTEVVGPDPEGQNQVVATAVGKHMNYQCITEMEEWEEEFDSLLMAIPIAGMQYKKTYFDAQKRRNVSRHVTPINLVINYYADKLENSRKTEVHQWTKNYIMERIAAGKFLDIKWDEHPEPKTSGKKGPEETEEENKQRMGYNLPTNVDSSTPFTVLEYHGWYDLDGDGYEEPYIITYIQDSQKILEIVPRFGEDSIIVNDEGGLVAITAYESYTKYGFIPNPDGSFYDIGFGNILYPINAVVNTAINMMLDAGASSIMNSGFVGRGLKMRGGMFNMAPNTWMTVNGTGEDIRKSFVPMPTKEPSMTLYSLMVYMVEAGQKLSSTTDIFSGEMPGQNTKTGVTQAVRDEGQKIFTAIYKRIRNALKKELDKLYELNGLILAAEGGADTLVGASAAVFGIEPAMYNKEMVNIQPSADPNMAVKEQKIQVEMGKLQLILQTGIGDAVAAQRDVLIAMEADNVDQLMPEGTQKPADQAANAAQMEASQADFEAQLAEKEFQLKVWEAETKAKLEYAKFMADTDKSQDEVGLAATELEFQIEEAGANRDERRADAANAANEGSMGGMEGQPS